MAFLICTCIDPTSKFLGLIPLRCAMIIMAGLTVLCGAYTYFESQVFFKDAKLFGVINNIIYAIIEGAIALMIFLDFFIKKRSYTLLLYLLTFALAGITLAYNVVKISLFNDMQELPSSIRENIIVKKISKVSLSFLSLISFSIKEIK